MAGNTKSRTKDRFVGVRFERAQVRKLITLSALAGQPGNLSAALRWAVDNAPVGGQGTGQQPERAPVAA